MLLVLSKVVERVVHSQLNAHLHQLDFLYQHQYGLSRGHSTEEAITQLNNWVLESMDEGKVTGLLFIDISKAFDSLNHKVLLRKLEHLGLSERSLRWFRSYLADRQQSENYQSHIPSHLACHKAAFWAPCCLMCTLIACQMLLKRHG